MTSEHTPRPAQSKRDKRVVETEEYVAMLHRMLAALERRLADDPAGLVHVDGLRDRLREAENAAIAASQERIGGYSFGELAAILGVSRPSVHQRAGLGRTVLTKRRAKLGVVSLRDRRRQQLGDAGVTDRRTAAAG